MTKAEFTLSILHFNLLPSLNIDIISTKIKQILSQIKKSTQHNFCMMLKLNLRFKLTDCHQQFVAAACAAKKDIE